jgi:hypothetical protein
MKKITQKTQKKYACKRCDFLSSNKYDYKRHLETKKHTILTNTYNLVTPKKHTCTCGKNYTHRQSLYFHRKKCSKFGEKFEENSENKKETELTNPENITKLLKTILQTNETILQKNDIILQENRELKKEMKNLKITNINNQNNNTFNVNLFLNEHCKNAMNLEDFVRNITVSLKDLDYTTNNGYVEGMTNILTKSLGDLSPTTRPIHSTDEKRLKFMVKNEEGWIKDDGSQLNNVVTNTKFKLVDTLSEWEKENPNYNNDSKKVDTWQKSLSAISPEASIKEKYDNIIKKKLAKLASIKEAMDSVKE